MAIGLTRQEQWALIGVVALILTGLGAQAWKRKSERGGEVVYVPGQGRWEKLADFQAGQTPQPLRINGPAVKTGQTLTSPAQPAPASGDPGGLEINEATAEELDRLPGIGPAKARAIVETRSRRGGFTSLDQLDQVRGIGPKLLERIRPYLRLTPSAKETTPRPSDHPATRTRSLPSSLAPITTAGLTATPPKPTPAALININTASAEQLDQVKHIGPALARRIIEDRQRRGPFTSVDDLARVKGIGRKTLEEMRRHITVK